MGHAGCPAARLAEALWPEQYPKGDDDGARMILNDDQGEGEMLAPFVPCQTAVRVRLVVTHHPTSGVQSA